MRIVVHGQQAFGKAVLEALLKRGENVIAVYVAPEKPGAKPDPLKEAALAANLPVYQPENYRKPEVWEQFRSLKPDLQVMAFVTLFVPEQFLNIPTHGSIQYHPSLLPAYRGPSAINWPIIKGEKETGLSIFWPDNGLDTGDVLLQKKTPISDTDTVGSVYFDRLFPMGVEAMLEAVDLVKAGKAPRIKQDESKATYEGRCGPDNAKIDWQAVDPDRPPDPRLQSLPGRLDGVRGKAAQDFRSQTASRQGSERHRRQDGRGRRRGRRRFHRSLRRRPHQSDPRAAGGRQEDRRVRIHCGRQARRRGATRLTLNKGWKPPCIGRPLAFESEIRYRDRPGGQAAADRRRRARETRNRARTSRALWPLQGQGLNGLHPIHPGPAERQVDPGQRDQSDAGRRGQDHHHGRPDRRAQPDRQEGDAVHPRAEPRALLRRQRWRGRRRLCAGRADGGHQPAFHRRPACHRHGQQSARGAHRQSHLLGQFAGYRSAADHLAPRARHERARAASYRFLARRRRQRLSA